MPGGMDMRVLVVSDVHGRTGALREAIERQPTAESAHKGHGGMPVRSNGRATLLISGGIDSPVAGYMMAKRGLELEAVHFTSPPYTSELAKEKVVAYVKGRVGLRFLEQELLIR